MAEGQVPGVVTEREQDITIIGSTRRDLKDYHCSICLLVLKKPHQTGCCGNHFCEQCLNTIKAANHPCPMCKEGNLTSFPDINMERELFDLTVECTAKDDGCVWTGKLRQLASHIDGECNFTQVDCRWNCGEKFQRRHISQHEESLCPNRPWYTRFEGPETRKVAQKVETLVSKNSELASQVETLQSSNRQLTAQVQTLQYSNRQLTAQVQTLQYSNRQLTAQIETLTINLNSQFSLLLANLTKKLDAVTIESEKRANELKDELKTVTAENQTLKCKVETLTYEVQGLRDISNPSSPIPPSLEHQLSGTSLASEVPKSICPFTLKMSKFSSRRTPSVAWTSPPFYTSLNGYKMCILVYADGAKEVKGSFVSLYVYLMRGHYDDDLKWPFHGKVNVTLLNQLANTSHHERPIDFPSDTGASKRVMTSSRSKHGLGFADYIPIGDLNGEDSEAQYLKDDCLMFEISVEMNQSSSIVSKIPVLGHLFDRK